jgi:hypothetical protein
MTTHLSWYGIAVGLLLTVKLLMSAKRRRTDTPTFRDTAGHSIHAVITV